MLLVMNAFTELVDDARLRLGRIEGHTVSERELARRAGIAVSTLNYHLSPKRASEGHRVPRDIIAKLARVLPVDENDLLRAAQVAAGYQVAETDLPDLGQTIVRYLRQDLTREERMRTLARLQEILAEEMRRAVDTRNGNGE